MHKKMEHEMETEIMWWFLVFGGFLKLGVPFWVSYNQAACILGSIVASKADLP